MTTDDYEASLIKLLMDQRARKRIKPLPEISKFDNALGRRARTIELFLQNNEETHPHLGPHTEATLHCRAMAPAETLHEIDQRYRKDDGYSYHSSAHAPFAEEPRTHLPPDAYRSIEYALEAHDEFWTRSMLTSGSDPTSPMFLSYKSRRRAKRDLWDIPPDHIMRRT